jgi:RNA polymerase sigma-B factor
MSASVTQLKPTRPPVPAPRSPSDASRADATTALVQRARSEPHPGRRRDLLEEVVLLNRPVAETVAHRFRNRGVPMEDLEQVACEGLTKAVLRFDPDLGNDLLTYAIPMIRGEVQRHLRDHGWSVRPPRRLQQLQRCIVDAEEALAQRLGRRPRRQEVMDELELDPPDYQEAMAAFGCKHATSLDQPVGDGGVPLGTLMTVEDRESAAVEARLVLAPLLRALPERDCEIVYLRFFEDLTQREIGERLGVTQMQVSRLLTQILSRLRAELAT